MIPWHPSLSPLEGKSRALRKIQSAPPLILSGSVVALIILGALLLKLPMATVSSISWGQSLFTAASAVTVTGLIVVDTETTFTLFGHTVIALLIQLGGLGLMTFAVVTLLALGGKIGFLQRTVAKEAFNQTDTSTLASIAKSVFLFSMIIESIGFVILSVYWHQELGWSSSAFHGFFYSLSAFNNAGFALSNQSLMPYVRDPVVNLTLIGLIVTGGLGFTVWMDVLKTRRWRGLAPYSKLMIVATVLINFIAIITIYAVECQNPNTLAPLSPGSKWLASGFQAVTPRTAGFYTIDVNQLKDGTTALFLLLMFIGGGSLSTASGIKVVTFVVLILSTYGYLRRDPAIQVFGREIAKETVRKALALAIVSAGVCWLAIFCLLLTENAPFLDVVFEAISAFGTVGLSRGLTASLSTTGQFIIMLLMLTGRLGPLILAYFLASPRIKRLRYPDVKLTIG